MMSSRERPWAGFAASVLKSFLLGNVENVENELIVLKYEGEFFPPIPFNPWELETS